MPPAKDCLFLLADKPFLVIYPAETLPASGKGGKRTVWFRGTEYFLTVTREGWFALFPLDADTETMPVAVILRCKGADTVFTDPKALQDYLEATDPLPIEILIKRTVRTIFQG